MLVMHYVSTGKLCWAAYRIEETETLVAEMALSRGGEYTLHPASGRALDSEESGCIAAFMRLNHGHSHPKVEAQERQYAA